MASDSARPELAFDELERLVGHLAEELASFRRRALAAEARLRELHGEQGVESAAGGATSAERIAELEQENAELTRRLEEARRRTERMLERMRFFRQQARAGVPR